MKGSSWQAQVLLILQYLAHGIKEELNAYPVDEQMKGQVVAQ